MIPTPQRDSSGRPIVHGNFEMNRDQLILAFQYMAEYLRQQRVNLTIYVAGGAVNTIYLRSRHTTGDVDFFGANEQSRALKDASKYAQQRSKSPTRCELVQQFHVTVPQPRSGAGPHGCISRRQNVVLFSELGLTHRLCSYLGLRALR